MNNLAQSTNSQDTNFLSNQQLRTKIAKSFHPLLSLLNSEQQTQTINSFLEEFPVVEAPSIPGKTKVIIPGTKLKTYRAIKKSDLAFFDRMIGIAVAAFFATPATALIVAKPAIVTAILSFIYKYFSKGIPLNYEQALVLNALKEAAYPGFSPDFIARWISDKNEVSIDEVKAVLESIKNIRNSDGVLVNLVQETDGLWSAIDL